jgi:hypothetical protein
MSGPTLSYVFGKKSATQQHRFLLFLPLYRNRLIDRQTNRLTDGHVCAASLYVCKSVSLHAQPSISMYLLLSKMVAYTLWHPVSLSSHSPSGYLFGCHSNYMFISLGVSLNAVSCCLSKTIVCLLYMYLFK